MIPRPDLLPKGSLTRLEVFQLTDESVPSCHVYMEAQIFTPDSRRFVLHRSAHAHGSDAKDPGHRYLVCDIDDRYRLRPLTEELGATALSVTPDGRYAYYCVDETEVGGGRLTVKRVGLDGAGRETVLVLDGPIAGTPFRVSRPYPLSTISSDGKRLAIGVFLGDGRTTDPSWGLVVFELETAEVRLVLQGTTWPNTHPQYCRSTDPEAAHDVLVQENHSAQTDPRGTVTRASFAEEAGIDIHVVRDDGTSLRNLPWGRDGNECCQGHQCWRGRSRRAITSTVTLQPKENRLVEGLPAPFAGHVGIATPGGRNDLTRSFPQPFFYHFATDIAGRRLIADAGPWDDGGRIYLADFAPEEDSPLQSFRLLTNPRCSWKKSTHAHPFLSPDGTMAFFNSDESGILQAYMIRGVDNA